METSRRLFLGLTVGAAGAACGAGLSALLGERRGVDPGPTAPPPDDSLLRFWTEQVRDRDRWSRTRTAAQDALGQTEVDYTPTYYIAGDTGPLTPTRQLQAKDLVPSQDVLLDYKVITYKPSLTDAQRQYSSGSLRVDVSQQTPPPQFSQAFSWSTLSTLALSQNNGVLSPVLKDLVDPASARFWDSNSIVLPGGKGYLANNLFLQQKPRHDFWHDLFGMLTTGVETVGICSSIGLPLVSQTALKYVDGLYGTVAAANAEHTQHVFQSSDMPIATTQAAIAGLDPNDMPLAIKTGDYVAVPQSQSVQFESDVTDNYTLLRGYLVPRGTTDTNEEALKEMATNDKVLQQYTYMVVRFSVQPYTMPNVPPSMGPLLGNMKSLTDLPSAGHSSSGKKA